MHAPSCIQKFPLPSSLLAPWFCSWSLRLRFLAVTRTEFHSTEKNLRKLLAMAMESPKVQHVSKAASDKLLVKFSDVSVYDFVYSQSENPSPSPGSPKGGNSKKKRGTERKGTENSPLKDISNVNASRELDSIVTWKTSLNGTVRKPGFGSHLKSVGNLKNSRLTAAQINTYALISAAAEKAWRKALRGATKCLMGRHVVQPARLRKELLWGEEGIFIFHSSIRGFVWMCSVWLTLLPTASNIQSLHCLLVSVYGSLLCIYKYTFFTGVQSSNPIRLCNESRFPCFGMKLFL